MLSTNELSLFDIEGNVIWKLNRTVFSPDIVQGLSWPSQDWSFALEDPALYVTVYTYPNDRRYTLRVSDGSVADSKVVGV
jgi:hypothetical protein